jgi:invasion protein IalB
MRLPFKKLVFILSGLVIIGAGFFLGKSNIVQASARDGQKFGDWAVSCIKDEGGKKICQLNQQSQITKDDKTEILGAYQVGYFGDDKKLIIIQILPLGSLLQPGTAIIVNEKLLAPGKFTNCLSQGCRAIAEITENDLTEILNADQLQIGYVNLEGKTISVPLSNKGLKDGLAAIKK